MKKIHSKLIDKTSKLVNSAKKSQFLGFFSPRRLRNRVKQGNFSLIAWSPVINRRGFSPNIKFHDLNNTYVIDIDANKKRRDSSLHNAHFDKLYNQKIKSNFDIPNYMPNKYQDSHSEITLDLNEELIREQQRIMRNFHIPSKFVLS